MRHIFCIYVSSEFKALLFLVSGKFHRLFDTNKWLLLPEPRIIDKYMRALPYVADFPDIEVDHCLLYRAAKLTYCPVRKRGITTR